MVQMVSGSGKKPAPQVQFSDPSANNAQAIKFSGNGPPPDAIPGAVYGDSYLDLLSGDVYRLDP